MRFAFVFQADGSVFDEGCYVDDVLLSSDCALHVCENDAACADQSGCSVESCTDGLCVYTWEEACCAGDSDCDDENPCTRDRCTNGACVFTPLGDDGCCVQDDDCFDDDPCTNERCEDNTCVVDYDVAACPLEVPYTQDFAAGLTFGSLGWSTWSPSGAAGNWRLTNAGHDYTRGAQFYYSPIVRNFEQCLRTPRLAVGPRPAVELRRWQRFSGYGGTDGGNILSIRWSVDDWASEAVAWSWHEMDGELAAEPPPLNIELGAEDSHVALAFCVEGAESWAISYWTLDDVAVTSGHAPVWGELPASVTLTAGSHQVLPVSAEDADGDPVDLSVEGPDWATLTPTSPYAAELRLAPGPEDDGSFSIELFADDGTRTVPAEIAVLVEPAPPETLFLADFESDSFEALGWSVTGLPEDGDEHWQLADEGGWGSRHARFEGDPALADFSLALTSPEIDCPEDPSALRLTLVQTFLPRDEARAEPPVSLATQIAIDGGPWDTLWSWDESQGAFDSADQELLLGAALTGARSFRLRFRVRGADSSAIEAWAIDDVAVLSR